MCHVRFGIWCPFVTEVDASSSNQWESRFERQIKPSSANDGVGFDICAIVCNDPRLSYLQGLTE